MIAPVTELRRWSSGATRRAGEGLGDNLAPVAEAPEDHVLQRLRGLNGDSSGTCGETQDQQRGEREDAGHALDQA
ncbi:hypothetical protein [Deinococcus apachensis]|uniref:hypothetical protein n=1 Tax=Deinococcus apachensis TaxID=309886 RepID=UPI0003A78D8E|nr:hypothetical protein [Deinococcus apachensis]